MKHAWNWILTVFAVVIAAVAVYAGTVINGAPQAHYSDLNMIVTWSTIDESGVKSFDIYRAQVKGATHGEFTYLVSIDPAGSGSRYEYTDRGAYKTTDNLFVYKIRVMFQDGSFSDSDLSRPALMSSAAKRTWGSIKAMFR
jgi:hypothetical protein